MGLGIRLRFGISIRVWGLGLVLELGLVFGIMIRVLVLGMVMVMVQYE